MNLSPRRRLALAALPFAAITMNTCADNDSDEAGNTEPPVTEPVTEPVATEPAATEPRVTEPVATEAAVGDSGGAACLVGEWIVTQDEMNSFYDAIEANADGPGISLDVVGEVGLTFSADSYVYVADFALELAVAGQTGSGVSTGSVSGTYETVDGNLITAVGENSLDVQVTVGGVTIDGSDFADGFISGSPINDAPFSCDGPTIFFQTGDETDPRQPVLLTPA